MLLTAFFASLIFVTSGQECGQIRLPTEFDLRSQYLTGENPRDAIDGIAPWTLSLEYEEAHVCGATLIADRWALTAAKCVADRSDVGFRVIAGVVDRTSRQGEEQVIDVENVIEHPGFENDGFYYPNDIALLELAEDADIAGRRINTICLPPTPDTKYWENPSSLITGWGLRTAIDEDFPDILQQAWVDVLRPAYCDLRWPEGNNPVNHTYHQCVLDQVDREVSICEGDEGGPLQSMVDSIYYLAAIGSFYGEGCDVTTPSVFTDVPTYLDWILDITGIELDSPAARKL